MCKEMEDWIRTTKERRSTGKRPSGRPRKRRWKIENIDWEECRDRFKDVVLTANLT